MFCCCFLSAPETEVINNDEDDVCCWICLEPGSVKDKLQQVCKCHTLVHEKCIRKWQKVKSGTLEEHSCRFCKEKLSTLPIPRRVNVFFNDRYVGDVIINYSFYVFKESLIKIIDKYKIGDNILIDLVGKEGVHRLNLDIRNTTEGESNEIWIFGTKYFDVLYARIVVEESVST